MKRIFKTRVFGLLLLACAATAFAQDDGQAPTIMPVDPSETYYAGNSITLSAVVMDQSPLKRVLLFYKFSSGRDGGYTSIPMILDVDYSAEIPFNEVLPGNLSYYFLAEDIYGNQSTWPINGDRESGVLNILASAPSGRLQNSKLAINLVNPENGSSITDGNQILVLSIFDPDKLVQVDDLHVLIDDEDVTAKSILSTEMITFVPQKKFVPGEHNVVLKIIQNGTGLYTSNFNFTVIKPGSQQAKAELGPRKASLKEKLNLKMNLGVDSDFDQFSGKEQPDNRPLDTHKLSASVKSRIWKIKFNASALLNTHILDDHAVELDKRRQPLDRLKVDMRSPLLDVMYGDYSPEFTELTLKGTRVRGLSSQFRLPLWVFGQFNASYVKGESKQFIAPILNRSDIDSTQMIPIIENGDTTFIDYTKGTPARQLEGARAELDLFRHLRIGVGGFRAYDEYTTLNAGHEELNTKYTFLGNAVAGTDLTLHFNHDRTVLHGELALSAVNDVMADDSILINVAGLDPKTLDEASKYLGFNLTDDLALGSAEGRGLSIPFPNMDSLNAVDFVLNDVIRNGTYRLEFMTPLNLYIAKLDVNAEYKRVPANYVSLGNASIQTDIQSLKTNARARFLKNMLTVNGGYESKFDNVAGNTKPQTTNTLTTMSGVGLNIPHLPSVSYSMRIMDRSGSPAEGQAADANLILNDNETVTQTITPSYRFSLFKTDFNFSGNLMRMSYADKNSNEITNNDFITESYLGTGSITLPSDVGITVGVGKSQTTPDDPNQSMTVFDIYSGKLSFKSFERKMNSFIGFNLVSGFKDKNGVWDNGELYTDLPDSYGEYNNSWNTGEPFTDAVEIQNSKFTLKLGTQYKINRQTSLGLTLDHVTVQDAIDPSKDYQELRIKFKLKIAL